MLDLFLLSILLCLIAGSAIDTGNVCVVRAAGALVAGKPAIAASMMLAMACAAIVFYLNGRLGLHRLPPGWAYPGLVTLAGAAIFAIGALINGACAIGTLGRLARGDVGYLATLLGGFVVAFLVTPIHLPSRVPDLAAMTGRGWLVALLSCSGLALVLARQHLRAMQLAWYVILGVSAAEIANWQGDWTWITLLQGLRASEPFRYAALACLGAVLLGAVLTAYVRGRFRWVRPHPGTMLREAAGGGLMVAGGALIPGGNDALLLYGVPSGSPHAVVAYLVMFVLMLVLLHLVSVFRLWSGWAEIDASPRPIAVGQ